MKIRHLVPTASACAFLLVATASATHCMAQSQPASAQTQQPRPYTSIRWDEDYSYLRDPSLRSEYSDGLKYIPLGDDSYLSLGGQARYRYELFNNNTFGAGPQDGDGYHLARFLLHADLHLGSNLRLFLQGKSALEQGREGGPRSSDADDIDLQQAFVDVILPSADHLTLTVRAGRQELLYGAQRVIGPSDWTNTRRTFEGAKVSVAVPNNALDVLWVRPVVVDKDDFNEGDDDTSLAGLYNTLALPGLIAGANAKFEAYALALNKRATAATPSHSDTYTLGARLTAKPRPWDFDVEAAWQFGETAGESISAYSFAMEAGYTIDDWMFKPRPFLGFDIASGSPDPGKRYNQLFPTGHSVFGYIDAIGRQNIVDVHPGVILNLSNKVTARADYYLFWRQNNDDAVYTASGTILRPDNGSDASAIGSEVDLLLSWQIDRHLYSYLGYSHFFAGSFIEQTGSSEDIDFVYVAFVYTF